MGSYHFCPQGTIPIHPRRPWYDYYLIAEAASLSEAHIFHSNGRESLPMTCYCTLIQFVVLWLVDNCLLADGAFSLLSLLLSVLSLSTTQLLETYDITSLQYIYGCIIRPSPAPLSTRRQWTVYNRMGHNRLLHEINTCVESVLGSASTTTEAKQLWSDKQCLHTVGNTDMIALCGQEYSGENKLSRTYQGACVVH